MKKKKQDKCVVCWRMDLDTAQKFYEICMAMHIDDPKQKEQLLDELMKTHKHMMKATYKSKSLDDVMKHYVNQYGNLLYIKPKDKKEDSFMPIDETYDWTDMINTVVPECPECQRPQSLMGQGWMCLNKSCGLFGVLITDLPDNYDDTNEEGYDDGLL